MKRALGLMVVVFVVLGLGMAGTAVAESSEPNCDEVDYTGDGDSENPYEITDAAELQCLGDGDDSDLDDHFELQNDIDLSDADVEDWNSGEGFDPIAASDKGAATGGAEGEGFIGSFDGNGYTISGLEIDRDDDDNVGLFGLVGDDGEVSDVTLENVNVTGGENVGGLVGMSTGIITDARATGEVWATGAGDSDYGTEVGGLVGRLDGNSTESGTISHSSAAVNVTAESKDRAGGLVGAVARDKDETVVTHSFATGNVTGVTDVGGLAGLNNGEITDSYATGAVTGDSPVGGLVGRNTDTDTSSITGSYSTGAVDGSTNDGGLVGNNEDSKPIDSYWDTEASGTGDSDGGEGLTTDEMSGESADSNMGGFDFEGTWAVDSGPDSYPYLVDNPQSPAPYVNPIEDWYDLDDVRENDDAGYALVVDLDSDGPGYDELVSESEGGFEPIGDDGSEFTGVFDGQSHRISDLKVDRGSDSYVGLFGYAKDAELRNLRLAGIDVTGDEYAGGLVGRLAEDSEDRSFVENVSVEGTVKGDYRVAGLVGQGFGSGSGTDAHGPSLDNENVFNGTVTGGEQVGGLVGRTSHGTTIGTGYVRGEITGDEDVGGIVGHSSNNPSIVENVYTAVEASGTNSGAIVGTVGSSDDEFKESVYWDEDLESDAAGSEHSSADLDWIGLSTEDMQGGSAKDEMNNLDWDDTWQTVPGDYPVFQWEAEAADTVEITGTVTDALDDEPLEGATVKSSVDETETDGDGEYELEVSIFGDEVNATASDVDEGFTITNTSEIEEPEPEDTLDLALGPDYDGEGTAESPFEVQDLEELQQMRYNLSAHYELTDDIDANDTDSWFEDGGESRGFEPIGTEGNPFTGTFDGNSYQIDGLVVDREPTQDAGLFGVATGSKVQITDLRLENVDITGQANVGGVAGTFDGPLMQNVSVDGSVHAVGPGVDGGGIGGDRVAVALVVGLTEPSHDISFDEIAATGTVSVDRDADDFAVAAGLVGATGGDVSVSTAYAQPRIEEAGHGGGAIGWTSNVSSTYETLYTTPSFGDVETKGAMVAIIGSGADHEFKESAYYNDTSRPAVGDDFGDSGVERNWQGLPTEDMQGSSAEEAMDNLDFENRWQTVANDFPVFQWQAALADGDDVAAIEALDIDVEPNSEGEITVVATDELGNVIENEEIEVEDDGGLDTLSAGQTETTDEDGEATFSFETGEQAKYTPEFSADSGSITDTATVTLKYAAGEGTDSDPYEIEDWHHLDNVRENLDADFLLVEDLDEETSGYDNVASETANDEKGFEPIGECSESDLDDEASRCDDSSIQFSGTVDGNGHVISNLTVDRPDTIGVGLFGISDEAVFENLRLMDVDLHGKENVGGLSGALYSSSISSDTGTVENVSVTGEVHASGPKAGGIVGHGNNADLTNQISFVGTTEATHEAGGIVGRSSGSTEVSFAYAQADVVTTGGDGRWTDDAAGGIVGDSGNKGAFEEIYFNGTVVSAGGENEGAIIGAVAEDDDHTNVHWNRDYAPQDGVGGGGTADTTNYHSLTTAEMQGSAAEENMDFDWEGTWQWVAGDYPVFQWEATAAGVGDPHGIDAGDVTVTAGESGTVSVDVTDEYGNELEDVTVEVVDDGGLSEISSEETNQTDASGEATFSFEETTSGEYALEFAWGEDHDVNDTATVTVEAADVSTVDVETQPAETTAGDVIGGTPTALVTDEYGNPVDGVEVSVEAIEGDGAITAGETTATTDEYGNTTFDDLVIETADEYRLEFSIDDSDENVDSSDENKTDSFEVEPAEVESVVLDPDEEQTITAGDDIEFNATAYDEFDNENETVDSEFTWTNTTDEGVFDNTTAGTHEVSAELVGIENSTTVTVEPAPVETVELDPSEEQHITAGETVEFNATAYDEFRNENETVDSEFTWTKTTDEGVFDNTTAGTHEVTAEIAGVENSTTVTVDPAAVETVELDPADDQTITAGETVEFNATAYDEFDNTNETDDTEFTWTNTTDEGIFDNTTTGTYVVSAEIAGVENSTTVNVEPAAVETVELDPSEDQEITAGEILEFNATAYDEFDNENETVDSEFTWANTTDEGVFDNTTAGTHEVSAELGGIENSTTVTIEPAAVDSVELDPSEDPEIVAGGTIQFNATAYDEFGNINEAADSEFTWTNASEEGVFDNTTAGAHEVTAELSGVENSTAVTVDPAAVETIELDPSEDQEIVAGETVEFNATAYDEFDNVNETNDEAFNWENATEIGVFDNTTVGTHEVTAVLDEVENTTPVTVEPAAIETIELDPADDQEITAGETVKFNATAYDEFDNINESADDEFEWTNATETGIFENTTAGTHEVTAERAGVKNSTTVTVEPAAVETVELDPADDQTITAGETVEFNATAYDEFNNENETVDSEFIWTNTTDEGVFDNTSAGTHEVRSELAGVENSTTVTVKPAAAHQIVAFDVDTDEIAFGAGEATVNATIEDEYGNRIVDESDVLSLSLEGATESAADSVENVSTGGDGNATVTVAGDGDLSPTVGDLTVVANLTNEADDATADLTVVPDELEASFTSDESQAGEEVDFSVELQDDEGDSLEDEYVDSIDVEIELTDAPARYDGEAKLAGEEFTNESSTVALNDVTEAETTPAFNSTLVGEYNLEATAQPDATVDVTDSDLLSIETGESDSLVANNTTATAGEQGEVLITLQDEFGNAISGEQINLTNTEGLNVSEQTATTNQSGVAPFSFIEEQADSYLVEAVLDTNDGVNETVVVDIESADPASLSLDANTDQVSVSDDFTDGNTLVANISAVDRFENPTNDTQINATHNGTDIQFRDGNSLTTDSDGNATFVIQSETDQQNIAFNFTEQVSGQNHSVELTEFTFGPIAPEASASANSYTVSAGTDVTFRGNRSTVPEDSNPQFNWTYEWDDGQETQEATGMTNTTSFFTHGEIEATLELTVANQTVTDNTTITVEDRSSPDVRLDVPDSVDPADSFTFDASATTDNVDETSELYYEWDFGNSTTVNGTGLSDPIGNYSIPGLYDVELAVTDAAGNTATNETTVTVEGSDASVVGDDLEFGEVGTNSTSSLSVPITNDGTTNLNVTSTDFVGENASAFNISGTDEPTIEPGETESLRVSFTPESAEDKHAELNLRTNSTVGQTDWNIDVEGTGIESDLVPVESTTDVGAVSLTETGETNVTFENEGTEDTRIDETTIHGDDSDRFSVVGDLPVIPAGETGNVTVAFIPVTDGDRSATLSVETNESVGGETDSAQTSVDATGQGPVIRVGDERVEFETIGINTSDTETESVEIRNRGSQPLEIDSAETRISGEDADAFEVDQLPSEIDANDRETLSVNFSDPGAEGTYNATLQLAHNDSFVDNESTIDLDGFAEAADAEVPRSNVNFGDVVAGESAIEGVTVTNRGSSTANLTILDTSISGTNADVFEVDNEAELETPLAPGESHEILVNLTTDQPDQNAQLRIDTDAANQQRTYVYLSSEDAYINVREVSNPTVDIEGGNLPAGSSHDVSVETPSTEASTVTFEELGMSVNDDSFNTVLQNSESAFNNSLDPGDDDLLQYVELNHTDHDSESTFDDTRITFSVDSDSIPADADHEDVVLNRYNETDGEWNALELDFIEETNGQFRYYVETPGFSEFAITVADDDDGGSPTPTPSPTPGGGQSGPATPPADTSEPTVTGEPSESGDRSVTIYGQQAGDRITVDGTSAGTGNLLSAVENIHVDSLDIGLTTDREVRFDISTYESDLTPSYSHETSPELSERLRSASASFEAETGTLSAGYVHIDHDLADEEVDDITFAFSIRQAYLDEIGVDAEEVTLYRQGSERWNALPTDQTDGNETYAQFESTSPGLSVFALGTGAAPVGVTEATLRDEQIENGETAIVDVTVENRGQHHAEHTVELTADGDIVATENVSLDAGETTEATLSFEPPEGEYAMAVDGTEAGTLTVGDSEATQPWLWLLIGLGVLIATVLWRRSQNADNEKLTHE